MSDLGDPLVGEYETFTFQGIRDHYDRRYAATASIPSTDVRILIIAGLISPATEPRIGDKIRIRGDDGTQVWHEVRGKPTVDPANAHFVLQCFEIPEPVVEDNPEASLEVELTDDGGDPFLMDDDGDTYLTDDVA